MIETGRTSRDGWGHTRTIMGYTTYDSSLVWSLQRDCSRQSRGRYVTAYSGSPKPQDIAANWDLMEELRDVQEDEIETED
jgi:hypothetical protein